MNYKLFKSIYYKQPTQGEDTLDTLLALQKKGMLSKDIVMTLLRFSKLILNPKDISPIFKGGAFLNHKSFKLSLDKFRADPDTKALIESRYLSPAPYDLENLLTYPEGSLGRVYAEHMQHYKLEVVFYPPLEQTDNDEIAYLRKRARQTHDVHHVVLGYPAVEAGEMAISAFYLAQYQVPLSALLLGFGFLYTILKEPQRIDELMTVIMKGWNTGKQVPKFMGIKWEEYWEKPIDEVRAELGLKTPLWI